MKILLIRFKWIGDVVLTSVVCRSLRRSFPGAQIDYLMHDASASLFTNHPDVDNVISITAAERKNILRFLRRAWWLKQQKYDVIIDASSTSRSAILSLFSSKAKYRIGRSKKLQARAYTHSLSKAQLAGDKIEQRLAMLKPLSDDGFAIELVNDIRLYPSDAERSLLKQRLLAAGVDLQRPIFAFSATAKESYKRWKPEYLRDIALHCIEEHRAQLILYHGLPHETEDVLQFHRDLLNEHPDAYANVKTSNLRELVALLSHCHLFVGHEGGPRHMAQAVGVPSVTVCSPHGRLAEWMPGGGKDQRHRAIEWQDVSSQTDVKGVDFQIGDRRYFELYHLIKPQHVIGILDEVLDQVVSNPISS